MAFRNTPERFGSVTRALHWVTVILVFAALVLGNRIAHMEVSLSALKFFGYHKTLGISVLALIVFRILWHVFSPPPKPLQHGVGWQDGLAKAVHRAFYVLLLAMPLTGWAASSASGIDTVVFGRWTMPAIAPVSERWEEVGFVIHGIIAKLLVATILLHVGGALYRAVLKKDGTLRRMITG